MITTRARPPEPPVSWGVGDEMRARVACGARSGPGRARAPAHLPHRSRRRSRQRAGCAKPEKHAGTPGALDSAPAASVADKSARAGRRGGRRASGQGARTACSGGATSPRARPVPGAGQSAVVRHEARVSLTRPSTGRTWRTTTTRRRGVLARFPYSLRRQTRRLRCLTRREGALDLLLRCFAHTPSAHVQGDVGGSRRR